MKTMQRIMVFGILFGCALFLACGGSSGGDGDSSTVDTSTLTVTEDNAQQIVSLAWVGESLGDLTGISDDFTQLSVSGADRSAAKGLIPAILQRVEQELYAGKQGFQASGSVTDSGACPYGGTLSITLSWNGPQVASDCSDISDLSATMNLNDCGLDFDTEMSGSIVFSVSGSLCSPTGMSFVFSNFDMTVHSEQTAIHADSLQLSVSELTWSAGGDYLTHARISINGDAQGSTGEDSYDARFDNYTQVIETQDDYHYTLSISGAVSGGCLGDQWVAVETLEDIEFTADGACPTAGIISVSGANEVLVTYNSDGSVDVGETHYDSCLLLNSECVAP